MYFYRCSLKGVDLFMGITINIDLNSIEKVKEFINDISKLEGEFDLISDRYIVDAKSIMGIFSLNLAKPLELRIVSDENIDLSIFDKYRI